MCLLIGKDRGSWREFDDNLIYYKNGGGIYNTHLRLKNT